MSERAGREVATPLGPARVLAAEPPGPVAGTLVLGSGAGGGVDAPDLVAVTRAAAGQGWRVLRVEQPWRVAGRRVAPAPAQLDLGWRAVLRGLRDAGRLSGRLALGGRSAGARVACRSAGEQRADGVLALAFPLHPPRRPERSRAGELALVDVPLLVVQGERDTFGTPAAIAAVLAGRPLASVRAVPGDHALTADVGLVAAAAVDWLTDLAPAP